MKRYTKSVTRADRGREPGSLHLQLRGFGQQALVSTTEVVEALDLLPRFHLEGLAEITFEPEAPPEAVRYHNGAKVLSTRRAEFIQHQRRIALYPTDTAPLFWQVLFHEIGHYVFFLIIDSHVKTRWVTQLHPHHFCVSDYATHDAQEDFAESYAAYVLAPQVLRDIPAKFEFMRDDVFGGSTIS